MPESVQRWHYRLVHFVPDPFVDERILVAVVVIGDRTEVLRRPGPRLDLLERRLVSMCLDALAAHPAPATSVPESWSEHMAMGDVCPVPEGVEDVRQWMAKAMWPGAARLSAMLGAPMWAVAETKRKEQVEIDRFFELEAERRQ
jgi:hypothetical protein